ETWWTKRTGIGCCPRTLRTPVRPIRAAGAKQLDVTYHIYEAHGSPFCLFERWMHHLKLQFSREPAVSTSSTV
ncbi:hypothetical protein T265_07147, partial [Opisthorchis viverrini]